MKKTDNDLMEKIVSLCKRRGFVYQGSEIFGGLAGTWDYGPLGVMLKDNIKDLWKKRFVTSRTDMYPVDAAILMNQNVWKASGHVGGFSDPLVSCEKCKRRFRADHLEDTKKCPECGGKLSTPRQFNMMFETVFGPLLAKLTGKKIDSNIKIASTNAQQEIGNNNLFTTEDFSLDLSLKTEGDTQMRIFDSSQLSFLRPETAQGMFVNFKNIIDSFHPELPFGMAQIGKAFRNEIAPRDFIFRTREFEQMEIEYFVKPEEWKPAFEEMRKEMLAFIKDLGLSAKKVHENDIPAGDLAHYSKRTIDIEYEYPFGRKELYGLAYRTDFDLKAHAEASKVDLSYLDEETKTRFVPHVIEPSFGVDRTVLAVLSEAYQEDMMGDEPRTYLKLPVHLAPYRAAVFPLLKNKPALVEKAKEVFAALKKEIPNVVFDDNGNIGKRYRRQDEISTPYCITIDFDTVEKDAGVTVRNRDTGKQERIAVKDIIANIK